MIDKDELQKLKRWGLAIEAHSRPDERNRREAGRAMVALVEEVERLRRLPAPGQLRGWRRAWQVLTSGVVIRVDAHGDLVVDVPAPAA